MVVDLDVERVEELERVFDLQRVFMIGAPCGGLPRLHEPDGSVSGAAWQTQGVAPEQGKTIKADRVPAGGAAGASTVEGRQRAASVLIAKRGEVKVHQRRRWAHSCAENTAR